MGHVGTFWSLFSGVSSEATQLEKELSSILNRSASCKACSSISDLGGLASTPIQNSFYSISNATWYILMQLSKSSVESSVLCDSSVPVLSTLVQALI